LQLRLPDLVFVKFSVSGLTESAVRIVPLADLQPGYRHLPLRSERDVPLELTSLFLRIRIVHHMEEPTAVAVTSEVRQYPNTGASFRN
jgi:hypothetical protein